MNDIKKLEQVIQVYHARSLYYAFFKLFLDCGLLLHDRTVIFYYIQGPVKGPSILTCMHMPYSYLYRGKKTQCYDGTAIIVDDLFCFAVQDGIDIVNDGESQNLKGTLALVIGDNLASHYLGGYKAPSGALRKCRQCMATAEDMHTKVLMNMKYNVIHGAWLYVYSFQFVATEFQPRTRETHSRHCASLCGPLQEHHATTYGVVRDSILNSSTFFHVTEGLVPDIMHDVLEGCAPYEVKELLKHLVAEGLVTLDALNDQIAHFPYAPPDTRNKPTAIPTTTFTSSDHSLKQKGMHMHDCYCVYTPFTDLSIVTFHLMQLHKCGAQQGFSP